MIPGVGRMEMSIEKIALVIVTGKELRAAIKGIKDTDRVIAMIVPVSSRTRYSAGRLDVVWDNPIAKKEEGGEKIDT